MSSPAPLLLAAGRRLGHGRREAQPRPCVTGFRDNRRNVHAIRHVHTHIDGIFGGVRSGLGA